MTTYVIPAPRSPVVDLDHLEHALDLALTKELRVHVVGPGPAPPHAASDDPAPPAGRSDDPWWIRFRAALADGNDDERYQVLDHCRELGWCHDDLAWRVALTVLCARLRRVEEARRELEAIVDRCLEPHPRDAAWRELAAHLADAAVSLGDARRADRLRRALSAGAAAHARR